MYIAGYVVPKTIILKMTGIMSSGIATGYIADKAHTAITNAKGSIIPKDSIFYTLLSIQVVRDVLNFFHSTAIVCINLYTRTVIRYVPMFVSKLDAH